MTTQEVQLLTVAEAARRLRLSPISIYRLTWSGELPSVKFGSAVRIPVDELDGFVEEHKRC